MTISTPSKQTIIGVDLGGTKVRAVRIQNGEIVESQVLAVPAKEDEKAVLKTLMEAIDAVKKDHVESIGIGVPSVVDVEKGIVYDVQNIPSWREVPLKDILQRHYNLPVHLNNDANCFALGEKHFGKGQAYTDFIGLIVGTGMAAGIIIDNKLYNGHNCGAGEFGIMPYKDHCFEYYASGQFFSNVYGEDGSHVYTRAMAGDQEALRRFAELGTHLGQAILFILYALDPQIIVLGGSVSKAYPLYKESLWKQIRTIVYHKIPDRLIIEVSDNPDLPVLGAGALCF